MGCSGIRLKSFGLNERGGIKHVNTSSGGGGGGVIRGLRLELHYPLNPRNTAASASRKGNASGKDPKGGGGGGKLKNG